MKKYIILTFFISFFSIAFAGGNLKITTMKGKVTDRDGNAIVGAKVVLLSSNREVYTDFDGNYEFFEVSRTEEQKIKVKFISFHETIATLSPTDLTSSRLDISLRSK